jgi:thiol-disulfide isomerase/thioredoxin
MATTGFERVHMPTIEATEWLNAEPLSPEALRGQVVLVDFWTLTCINWLRQEPYVRAWSQAYRDDGLVVIGVHTPEFSFEHDVDQVRQAVLARGIRYPVAVDNDYEIWRAFNNHYWPALYFVDPDGVIRDDHFGEGRYQESEGILQALLGIDREPVVVHGIGVEAEADWDHLRTPETYLGSARTRTFASLHDGIFGERRHYSFPSFLRLNHWALDGEWTIEREYVMPESPGASLACRFQARDAHLVLARSTPDPIPFRVFIDGEPPGPAHGVDVDEDGYGVIRDGRLYQLVRQPGSIGERIVEVTFPEPGAQAYAFTFG